MRRSRRGRVRWYVDGHEANSARGRLGDQGSGSGQREDSPLSPNPDFTDEFPLPVHHVISSGRVGRCSALFQPHLSRTLGQAVLEGWLQRGERKVLGCGPKLRREFSQKQFAIVASHLEHPIGERLAAGPFAVRGAPVDSVVVNSGHPERSVLQHSPAVDTTEDSALEAPACITHYLSNIQGSETCYRIPPRQRRVEPDHRGRVTVPAAIRPGPGVQVEIESAGAVARVGQASPCQLRGGYRPNLPALRIPERECSKSPVAHVERVAGEIEARGIANLLGAEWSQPPTGKIDDRDSVISGSENCPATTTDPGRFGDLSIRREHRVPGGGQLHGGGACLGRAARGGKACNESKAALSSPGIHRR